MTWRGTTSSWEKQQPSSRRSHPDGTVRADGRGEGELRGHPHGQAAGRDTPGLLRLAQAATDGPGPASPAPDRDRSEIGRASCRERGEITDGAVTFTKKRTDNRQKDKKLQ